MESHALSARNTPVAVDTWTPSRRLQSAAVAERQRLEREQLRVDQRVSALKHELAELQAVQAGLAERRKMLDLLAHDADGQLVELHAHQAAEAVEVVEPTEVAAPRSGMPPQGLVRGARIREAAVRALAQSPRAREAIHYREWYRLLAKAGFGVVGKDPEATFLTQLSRSPVVRRSTQAGIYELDFDFIPRAREQLQRLRSKLRATHDLPDAATAEELEAARAQRIALQDEIGALERQLQEALETLGGGG